MDRMNKRLELFLSNFLVKSHGLTELSSAGCCKYQHDEVVLCFAAFFESTTSNYSEPKTAIGDHHRSDCLLLISIMGARILLNRIG